jgi:rRNA maturation protein Nop10
MSSLKKCSGCKNYTLKDICEKCGKETTSAHYKFPKIRDAPPRSAPFKNRS